MACSLNKEQVLDVYEILYGEIIDRINDNTLPEFDLNQAIKDIYNAVNEATEDEVKALFYAQAVPDIFNLVLLDEEVNDYLVDNNFDFTAHNKQRKKFKDLIEVGKALASEKKSKDEIDAEIKDANKKRKNTSIKANAPVDELLFWSFNQDNGAKVTSAWTTSYQIAIAANPETVSEEDRNRIDPEKKLFSDVVKSIGLIARDRSDIAEPIMYEDVEIALTAMQTRKIDRNLLTTNDQVHMKRYPDSVGISAVITDKQGNFLYFKEDGSLTDNPEEGRIVYQYLRKVVKEKGKLLLSSRANRKYNMVEPEVLAKRQKEQIENNGGKVTPAKLKKLENAIAERQKMELNTLYAFRTMIEENDDMKIILPIVSGTLGQTNAKRLAVTLQEAGVPEKDLKNYNAITVGPKKGYQYVVVQRKVPGTEGTVPFKLQLQQGDADEVLAEKISSVLTTKAKLKGRDLTFEEREAFFNVYINNSIPEGETMNSSNILVRILKKRKKQSLQIIMRKAGKKITLTDDEIFTDESKQIIKNHLLNAKPRFLSNKQKKEGKKEGDNGYYPADIHYKNSLFGETFTDYIFEGDVIKTKTVRHFDAIKKYMKLEYTEDLLDFEKGLNAYLNYTIPVELLEDVTDIEVGRARKLKEKKDEPEKKSSGKGYRYNKTSSKKSKKKSVSKGGYTFKKTDKDDVKSKAKNKTRKGYTKNTKGKTKEEVKKEDINNNPATRIYLIDDVLDSESSDQRYKKKKGLDRARNKYLDNVFASKADRKAAEKWWANSPLSKYISLERITEITNSDAFARWSGYGITLFEADGGTSVDIYHEAWHGFSQLFLTKDEKVNLYEEIKSLDKYKNKTFFEVEEELAEQFRTYAKSKGKGKVKGFLGKIFDKIYKFLQKLFGKTTKNEVTTDLMNIESVKELYDKLYRASKNPELLSNLTPSMDNVIFGELNRSKTINENFSIQESKQVVDAMDSMAALIFEKYNKDFNTTTGAYDLLKNEDNKKELYRDIYDKFERLRLAYIDQLENNLDLVSEPNFIEELELLNKITDNYIGPNDVLDLGKKNNPIAYHLEKSRFKVLRDQYIEIEDPTNISESSLFKLKDDNSISAKKLAKEETMMLLASLFKTNTENDEPVRERGLFGLPKLQDVDITWNRLAKILEGSYDETDMYIRIFENMDNYPEFQQLMDVLPNPFRVLHGPEYSSREEFKLETAFWQDFKKPRIPYIQLNIDKDEDGDPKAKLGRANFDTYQVTRDWKSNFITSNPTENSYIETVRVDGIETNILNTAKVVKDFGTNGVFNYRKANDFLKAIGIVLDETSIAIEEIIESTENPFSTRFGIDRMYEVVKIVNKSNDPEALNFKKDPISMLMTGLPESLREDESQSQDVSSRLRTLAEIQSMFSDSYSNFSVQTPEGTRVWEHMVDNTITRIVTAINAAENWQELTTNEADLNGRFKHMRWLNEANNTFSPFSKLLNTIFDLDPMSGTYGEKLSDTKLTLQHVAGTQTLGQKGYTGSSTASMDATSKFLQEIHTMLLNGVEEFMRHASKNTALGMSVDGTIQTYNGKKDNRLYVDIESFVGYSDGEIKAYDIIEGYIAAEANRIVRFQQQKDKFKNYAGYNRLVKRKDKSRTTVMAGQAFTAFDDILDESVQDELYKILDEASEDITIDFNLMDELDEQFDLREKIRSNVEEYFNLDTKENYDRLQEAKYIDEGLYKRFEIVNPGLTQKDIETSLMKAYTYNSFIHKMETVALAYGDLVQYNHAKEEFHKRNAGLASGGKGFRADQRAQIYVNSLKKYYADRFGYESRNYDGTFRTAIAKEIVIPSDMFDEYRSAIYDSIYDRTGNKTIAKDLTDKAMEEYLKMKIADGQGWVSIEAYRMLKELEGNWSTEQEQLYRKVAMGENITAEDVVQFFPPYKLQYFGNIEATGLPVNSFHKFSLAPLIPGVAKPGTPLYDLHQKMMKDQIDYVVMESGSKVSHIGTGDVILNEDGSFNKDSEFTVNTVFAEFLKNQTEVNSEYKTKTIFSTQLRKMILEGLYERGVIKSTKYEEITNTRVTRYIDHVEEYTELLKLELLEEMGYEEVSPGEYKAKDKSSTAKLLNIIRTNLEREDILSDDLIEFIDVFDSSGKIQHDLSFHPESSKIEKLILSMINKRVIKQKVNGEPLVQVSVGMFQNQFAKPDLRKATKDEIAKWASASYLLPTYHKKSDGYTAAAKVMIAMQGSYYNLFNLEYEDGETIGVYNSDPIYDIAFSELKSTKGDDKLFILRSDLTPEIESQIELDTKNGKKVKGKKYNGIDIIGDFYRHKTLKSKDGDQLDIVIVENEKDAQRQFDAYIKGGAKQFTGIGEVVYDNQYLNMDKSLERLNEKIKDDAWLDANDGANRKAITLVGVRIPVQGLNSMEFAEVFEFLPPQAGNIIIPPAEIVAKSGGDFDIDKLTIFMNTLNEDGTVVERSFEDLQSIKDLSGTEEFTEAIRNQKAALENELINDIKEILELPENYTSLVMPNGTFLLKGIADELAQYVSKYNPKKNKMTKANVDVKTGKEIISPTRVLEALYNVYKHESNIVGKNTLGLGAIENTFNVIMNAIGAYMPKTYRVKEILRESNMRLRHNKMTNKNGDEVISISDMYDVNGINKIADVISQMMNGWVDVEKDAWVFFIQGNYEVAPTLLYMVKAGVPVKEAIYFVSNPLVRDYVNEQRLFKSTYAEVLGKDPGSPGLAKYKAASQVIRKYFDYDELPAKSKNDARYTKGQELLNKFFSKRKTKYFTESQMLKAIKQNDTESDLVKSMFLHYLELEQQIGGYTKLKMASNPDTSTKTTLSDVEQTEANLDELFYDSRVPLEIVNAMRNDSILRSFFNGPLALAVSRPLFELRYHSEISEFLISKKDAIRLDIEDTFPGQNVEMFSNVFRNDIVSFILQNAIRKYNSKDGFMSLDLKTKIPTKLAKELKRGAFVKDGVLYMDMKQLKKEFRKGAWEEDSDVKNSYEDRGLYPLHPSTFRNNSETNFDEYLKFVAEREYLRYVNPLTKEYAKSKSFKDELSNTKETMPDLNQEKAIRYTYEKLLAIEALDNSFNMYHLFESENAFAIRFMTMLQDNPELGRTYNVVKKFKLDGGKQEGVYNIYLADKDFDNDKSNLYTDDLKKLANPGYSKVEDPVENLRISNMFKYLNIYAYLQTGLNKTKLNFTNVVDYNSFLSILENESKNFISALEKNGQGILSNFYEMFLKINDKRDQTKNRFKDYISGMDLNTVEPTETIELETGVKPTGTINVYWGGKNANKPENHPERILSNLAARTFTWEGREYGSVEHAYQSNKSGEFDQSTYDEYVDAGGYGTKIRGKNVKKGFDNLQLMKDLVVESFLQNRNSEAATILLQYEKFTHNTNYVIDKAFLEGLKLAQNVLLDRDTKTVIDTTNMDTEVVEKRLGLQNTEEANVYTYNDSNTTGITYYSNISRNNPDVVFLHNTSVYEIMPEQRDAGTVLGGSSYFMTEVGDMSINFPTDLYSHIEKGRRAQLPPSQYDNLKTIWENRIATVKKIQKANGKIAFPEYGFGDVTTMPEELFVYLSRRLFEEFQFVNPGSTMFREISKMVGSVQGITDEEILLQLELEEDPFKCL